jgi:hypothetical protein
MVKLKLGKTYKTRGGDIVKVVEDNYIRSDYRKFLCSNGECYTEDGYIFHSGIITREDIIYECDEFFTINLTHFQKEISNEYENKSAKDIIRILLRCKY